MNYSIQNSIRTCIIALFALMSITASAQPKKGIELLDSLKKELPNGKGDTVHAAMLIRITSCNRYVNPDEGIKYGLQAIELCEKLDWQTGLARAYGSIANNYMTKSDYVKAIDYYKKAQTMNEEMGDKRELAKNTVNIGIFYFAQGNYPKALENYFAALKIDEELKYKEDIASCLLNIGIVYTREENYPKSLEYFFKSLKMAEEMGDRDGIAHNYGNIGLVYKAQKNYPKALEYYEKGLKLNEEKGAKAYILADLGNIGNVYRNQRNYGKAFQYFFRSMKMAEDIGDKLSISISLGNIGECYLNIVQDTLGNIKTDSLIPAGKAANLQQSIIYLNKGMAISKELGDIDGIQEMSKNLSTALALSGDYKGALANQIQYTEYRDSIFSEKTKVKMAGLETQRAIDLKERDIQIEKLKSANKRNERVIYIAGIVLLLIVIGVVLRKFIVQARSNKELSSEKKKHLARIKEQSNVLMDIAHTQSHEIRGQVVTILGLVKLYNYADPTDPNNKELMEGITSVTERLDDIVKDVVTRENKFNKESKNG